MRLIKLTLKMLKRLRRYIKWYRPEYQWNDDEIVGAVQNDFQLASEVKTIWNQDHHTKILTNICLLQCIFLSDRKENDYSQILRLK